MTGNTPTLAEMPTKTGDDSILPFQLDRLDIRGRVARLDGSIDAILRQHDYPAPVSGLLAEATLMTALIGQTMKLRDRFSIQLRGSGSVRLLATDYFAPAREGEAARIRAYAGFEAETLPASGGSAELLGEGVMGVTIDHGRGQPYQGITPLSGDSLARCAEIYFAQSEQIATRFALASAQASEPGGNPSWRAGGMVIQHLPKASPYANRDDGQVSSEAQALMTAEDVASLTGSEDNWTNAASKLATVEAHELIGPHLQPEQLLLRLFHEDGPRVYPPQTVAFGCTCSSDKLEAFLLGHPPESLTEMAENGHISGDCQFCGAQYRYELESLLQRRDAALKGE